LNQRKNLANWHNSRVKKKKSPATRGGSEHSERRKEEVQKKKKRGTKSLPRAGKEQLPRNEAFLWNIIDYDPLQPAKHLCKGSPKRAKKERQVQE